ncbi:MULTISPECIES: PTS transporter subunit EIIC [Vibrio]|uniref:Permease IIC component n=3 Tax=Vibrio mediterranei TaxID=689 RepID=A0AAN1FKB8_9VIBR|nr:MULTISPECIES: PTS transporter subunit EIIC [Vibrio]ASI92216.1 PTS cellobiose transporter subunit IIC [Vibrio mediterranei]MCF4172893.1 PTS transporter subunit EIIC [Vibrio sp. McD22-P3]MCG9623717.1 PTS transporter subunit EIIC [Vibrio mediterranei]MCG9660119.1 PTS transporter subunit EIIC [Vibrio mediterranei]MCG9663617.1 PTS transporter subunit EIIC [Vibrio mediterranei]
MNHSVMRLFANQVEQFMNPIAKLLMRSQHLMAMRDGFQLAMPFIFVGCMFVPIIFPPFANPESWMSVAWLNMSYTLRPILLPTYQLTLGVVGLIVSFGVSASLAKSYQLPERLSGLTGCMAFLMLAGFYLNGQEDVRYLGGSGLFTALIASIYSIEVVRLFIRKGWYIKMPEDVPILTIQSFKLMIPIFVVLSTISTFNVALEAQFGVHFPQLIEELFRPLVLASDSLVAVLVSILICQLLWFMGIHGALIITGIMNPFWMSNLLENQTALEAGEAVLPHIYLPAFWDFFLLVGGVGSTLPLVYLAIKSRSNQLKSVGKVGAIPAIFNINEPILFGFPIIMNPLFLVPFVMVPMINATLAWFLTSAEILDRVVLMIPWSVPAPIGAAWAANGSVVNALMVGFAMLNSYFIYLPFFKAHEKILVEQEAERAERMQRRREVQ